MGKNVASFKVYRFDGNNVVFKLSVKKGTSFLFNMYMNYPNE